ncbi:hypothetical protein PIB30_071511 [Stylosanthes scabra]|uniref:Retrotransposon gag domain-containing protein n=1 Tax=Stylosanthes scabra TaxID=79078 RepID=A0ABU6WNE7_9FABA|nr:hypothetical protein [Stylosanthes scabra]
MVCDGAIDEFKCRAFSVTLTVLASKWFTSLAAASISTFSDVKELFLTELTTSIDNTKHLINLLAVIQRLNESTRKYVERFNEECKTIDGLTDSVASLCLKNGLSMTNSEATDNQTDPITEIYHQIYEKGAFPRARPLKGRTQNVRNRSLFCDYYQGYRHKTQDYYDLKDAIEQAIQDENVNEFAKIIRELKNLDRERSPRSETCNPRNQRDEDDEPMTLVNVITGSSGTEKSKSALKKDLKILAAVRTPPSTCPTIQFGKED